MLPVDLVMSPFREDSGDWEDSRNRSLMLGLPAVVVMVLAIVVFGFMQIGRKDRMESWYTKLLETAQSTFKSQSALLSAQQNLAKTSTQKKSQAAMDEIKELEAHVELLREQEQIYLEKLIDLNPENPDYKYQLAMAYQGVDPDKQRALLTLLAPEDRTVYYRAHDFKAQQYFNDAQKARSTAEKKVFLEKALIHADHCLVQKEDDRLALLIKARILLESEKYQESAEIFGRLFIQRPEFYRDLVYIAAQTGNDDSEILLQAIDRFRGRLRSNRQDDVNEWVACWKYMNDCWLRLKDYQTAIDELQAEFVKQQDPVRKKFLNDEIAKVYTGWAGSGGEIVKGTESERRIALDRLLLAYKKNPKNENTLRLLALIVANDETFGAEARAIYDPYLDPNPPGQVLSELGTRSLNLNEYETAIQLFDRARKKSPQNPVVLNNLAYAHLVSQKGNAKEALKIIEQGLRTLGSLREPEQYASHLLHTRGTALMQLSRMEEAAASFESALRWRPEHEEIVESLVSCYEGRIDAQSEMYREYLAELRARPKPPETDE